MKNDYPLKGDRSPAYFRVRKIVRIVFWSAFTFGVIYFTGKIGGGRVN
jgi:hypothetical protein